MNNLFLKRMMGSGPGMWTKISATPLVVSGTLVGASNAQIRFDGGTAMILPTSVPLPFTRVDLSRVEFSGDLAAVLSVIAGSW